MLFRVLTRRQDNLGYLAVLFAHQICFSHLHTPKKPGEGGEKPDAWESVGG